MSSPILNRDLAPGVTLSASLARELRPNPEEELSYLSLDWTEEVDEEVGETPRRLWLHLSELRPFIRFLQDTEKALESRARILDAQDQEAYAKFQELGLDGPDPEEDR